MTLCKGQECPRGEESAALLMVKETSAASFMAVGPTWVCSELVQLSQWLKSFVFSQFYLDGSFCVSSINNHLKVHTHTLPTELFKN